MTRTTWIAAGLLALFVSGFVLGTHYSSSVRHQETANAWSPPHGTVYCDDAKTVPFIPAEECGGITSCDRLFNRLGTCDKPLRYAVPKNPTNDFIPGTGGLVRRIPTTE